MAQALVAEVAPTTCDVWPRRRTLQNFLVHAFRGNTPGSTDERRSRAMPKNRKLPKFHKESQAKSWKAALSHLSLLHSQGCHKVLACTAALSKCSGYHWRHAVCLLSNLAPLAVEGNTITYNAATSACHRGRRWQSALRLQRDRAQRGIEADIFSHNSVVSASEAYSQWQGATLQLASMKHGAPVPESRPQKLCMSPASLSFPPCLSFVCLVAWDSCLDTCVICFAALCFASLLSHVLCCR